MDVLDVAGSPTPELIDLRDPRERAYWAHVLSISEDELKRIVDRVGPRAVDVRHHATRARRAEWQHQPQQDVAGNARASGGEPFALIVCAAGVVATMLGALAYGLMPPDEWTVFQREHGCEAVANSDRTIRQLRCPDGRTIVRTKVAGTADGTTPKPVH